MNTDLAFADAVRPARFEILRLPMLDYSIGHELLLLQQRNPLILLSSGDFDARDDVFKSAALIRAALVCSRNWRANKKPARGIGFWGWLNRKANWLFEIETFRLYRAAGSTFPATMPAEGPASRELGSPYLARLLAFANFDYDFPLGALQWAYLADSEAGGNCRVENATDRKIAEEMAQHEADFKREQEAACQT